MRTETHTAAKQAPTIHQTEAVLGLENALMQALRSHRLDIAKKTLNTLLGQVFASDKHSLEYIKDRCAELITLMSRTVCRQSVNEAFDFGYEARQNLATIDDNDALLVWMNHVLKCFFGFLGDTIQEAFFVESAMAYMRSHAHEPITLSEVARQVYMSPGYFGRRFKGETGKTFSQCLKQTRVELSINYVKNTSFSLADIAHVFKFSDQSHYTRAFKQVMGKTPNQYRADLVGEA